MTFRVRIGALRRDERGGVLLFMAVALPVLILFLGLVLDVSNWFEHKRHLQTQADAAVLAAAGDYIPDPSLCSDAPIDATANQYGGSVYNPQVGGSPPGNIKLLINSEGWYDKNTGSGSRGSDPDFAGGTNTSPCASLMIDAKLTELDLPWFLRLANVDYIDAHARVEIRQATTQDQALPLAVPDPRPVFAAAIFVDEANGIVIGTKALTNRGLMTLNGKTLVQWDNVGDSATFDIQSPRTGVVIMLSGKQNPSLSGSLSTICNQTLVECYSGGEDGPWQGLEFVHGYPSSGGSYPAVRDARLYNGTCADTSAPGFVLNGGCTVGFAAEIDFGPGIDPLPAKAAWIDGPGCPNAGCPLTKNFACPWDASKVCWTTTNNLIRVDSQANALRFGLNWEAGRGASKVSGSIASVQGTFGANDDPVQSGPVEFVRVVDPATLQDSNSVLFGPNHFYVAIGVLGSLENAKSVNDPVVKIRVVKDKNGNASQTQALDCDPNLSNLKDELAKGCGPLYKINTGEVCPGSIQALWSSAQPWPCVAVATGAQVNQIAEGLNIRIFGDPKPNTCPPLGQYGHNNWSMWPNLPKGDPRIVQVFTTPFGTFTGSGNTTFPVQTFATFYITGYTGQGAGFDNPCQNDGDQWSDPQPKPAYVYGHFIKYVQPSSAGGGDELCDLNAFGNCAAALTR